MMVGLRCARPARLGLWGPAVDQILAEEAVDGGTADLVPWTLTDHLNTVRDIAKYDPGSDMTTVVNHLIYDAFGRVTAESNPAVDSLFLFTARPFDPDTVLQNNLNRWYDFRVGRWLSEDPIGFAGGDGNLYQYVGNCPILVRDWDGRVSMPSLEAGPAIDAYAYVVNKNLLSPDTIEVKMRAWVYASCDDCGNVCYRGHNTEVVENKWDMALPGHIHVTPISYDNRRAYQVEWIEAKATEGDASFGESTVWAGGIAGGVVGGTVGGVIGAPGGVAGGAAVGSLVGIGVGGLIGGGGFLIEEMFDLEATWQFRWQWWLTCEERQVGRGWSLVIQSRPESLIFATNSWSNQYEAKYE